jgi:DNA-binding LytR/AlgR family response regulator
MKQLEEKLTVTTITLVDRSHFINKAYVQKVVTASNRCYFISTVNLTPIEFNETGIRNLMGSDFLFDSTH